MTEHSMSPSVVNPMSYVLFVSRAPTNRDERNITNSSASKPLFYLLRTLVSVLYIYILIVLMPLVVGAYKDIGPWKWVRQSCQVCATSCRIMDHDKTCSCYLQKQSVMP